MNFVYQTCADHAAHDREEDFPRHHLVQTCKECRLAAMKCAWMLRKLQREKVTVVTL